MPRRGSLFGYYAMVRTPLRSPTTDVAVPPTFEPRQPPLVSWHFVLLSPQVSVPISADHCLLQRAPECNALPAPSSFSNTALLLCLFSSVARSPRSFSGQVATPENSLPRGSSETGVGLRSSAHTSVRSALDRKSVV